ncbi:N-acetyllactosaminide 3-alpha-galactosyltransferase [Ancylostoma caninum]|uniref:N-acetylgalactosaminide beta-1,3-galactosyltransferase n=1 Tax=Ancylostoma caninum TaxID=29170 RepID=A0A368FJD2_ANCCA|nr:N-acetyllactosaminide 3-alpha-galactosyltransferase [Ancylostoma caninum]
MNISKEDVYVSEAARRLPKKGRLLCFVITTPRYHNTRVPAINETWLPRCDHGQFFTSEEMDSSIPHSTVLANLPDDYDYLFHKTLLSFYYAFSEISDKFDWYYKADDDTYVVMEHMYEYLATLDPNEPYYLGYTLKPYLTRGYNGGGAGYVLSRAALKLFLNRAYGDRKTCPFDPSEDLGMGRCLESIEIFPHDTRNEYGQQRFHTYRPDDMYHGKIADEWHYYQQIKGHNWIAPDLISLHHLTPDEIRTFDDLLYRMRSPQLSNITKQSSLETTNTTHHYSRMQRKEMRDLSRTSNSSGPEF